MKAGPFPKIPPGASEGALSKFREYLDGKGANSIAKDLELDGVLNWHSKPKWYESSIREMLTNEEYKGDALLHKTYTIDFLTKKRMDNTGQVPQYYVEESHPAIIDPVSFLRVIPLCGKYLLVSLDGN